MSDWGPEIDVGRKMPEWLDPSDEILIQNHYGRWEDEDNWHENRRSWHEDCTKYAWDFIQKIKLRPDHPYYKAQNTKPVSSENLVDILKNFER